MIDFDGTLNDAISATLGDEKSVTFLPRGGGSFPVLGVFTLITDYTLGDDGEPDANITVATLGMQISKLTAVGAAAPAQSDGVRVDGVSYVVKDVQFDGLGWAYMDLGKQ
ncbi:head-tail joining protein [Paraburkholderia tropica]|uniref:head-tail joining protein n=1 Tax=Paraburkholderia tropica TaxID=92647 RepID=UPI00160F5D17|nr:hypothetical protein [Paraburkholderia tropica]MBB6320587.1 hypothetical protein [Paraburkholderia tropica]